ncbi:hypothetical protein B0T16DRAFT_412318 [Cercophora newfieldiana]|uniref:Uncharacterized protein n=1 Tax=Cercophora newfieldiana TaxID=92897 RepID=A0AA39Y4U7_9PEZI|nr:hypothetical protein B0T16DRAFT_412318 [Cercophora newfieldiana]
MTCPSSNFELLEMDGPARITLTKPSRQSRAVAARAVSRDIATERRCSQPLVDVARGPKHWLAVLPSQPHSRCGSDGQCSTFAAGQRVSFSLEGHGRDRYFRDGFNSTYQLSRAHKERRCYGCCHQQTAASLMNGLRAKLRVWFRTRNPPTPRCQLIRSASAVAALQQATWRPCSLSTRSSFAMAKDGGQLEFPVFTRAVAVQVWLLPLR